MNYKHRALQQAYEYDSKFCFNSFVVHLCNYIISTVDSHKDKKIHYILESQLHSLQIYRVTVRVREIHPNSNLFHISQIIP
jgi:hypothetical protein